MSSLPRLHAFVTELKRRRVFRVAVGYAAIAFATVSVASDFLPALRLPQWTVTFVAVLTLLGFPIALVLAWVFDITPDGVQRVPATEQFTEAETLPAPAAPAPAAPRRLGRPAAGYFGVGMVVALVSVGSVSQFGLLPFLNAEAALPSIAVLPFENITGDPDNDYFSAGIHEDVMTQLYKLGGITVISRTSVMQYRGTTKPIRAVGHELGVGAVLEASVRRSGSRVRIDARLIDAATDRPIWAETYDREMRDVLVIQAEIAQQIAAALHARLSPVALTQLAATRNRSVDPAMYEVHLRGLFEAGEGRHRAAIAKFQQALELDPGYAPAHAGIARSLYSLGFFGEIAPVDAFVAMRDAAARAIELDPDLADAHATLALYHLHYRWDWEAADRHFRRALQLSPNHAQVRHDYAHYLLAIGRIEQSVAESARAVELDPGNTMLKACAGWHDFTDREYDNAVAQAMGARMMMPTAFWPELVLGWAYEHKGQHGPAIASLRNAVANSHGSPFAVASLAHALARSGERTPARHLLAELLAQSEARYVSAYDVALVHAGLGDRDQAFAWLRTAYAERSAMLVNIGWDPRFDGLRNDARFAATIGNLKLPDRPAPRPAASSAAKPAHRGM
jgi:TolB-like protein/Tfp pilus assembly protein PilF